MKKDLKERIEESFDTFLAVIMFASLVLVIPEFLFGIKMLIRKNYTAAVLLLMIAVISLLIILFYARIDAKCRKKKERLYAEKYLTEIKVRDLDLGELVFYHDSCRRMITLDHGVPAVWGGGELSVEAYDTGLATGQLIDCIKRVLRDREKIVKGMCETVKDVYENEGITVDEKEGVAVDEKYILSHLSIDTLCVSPDKDGICSAQVLGGMDNGFTDHIDEHGLTADLYETSPDYVFYSG